MNRNFFLFALWVWLLVLPVSAQVYIPLYYTNSLASSSGANSLLGVSLQPTTTLQGYLFLDSSDASSGPTSTCPAQIEFLLSDGVNSYFTSNSVPTSQSPGYRMFVWQNFSSKTLTVSNGLDALPWGGIFDATFQLAPSLMGATINDTLNNLTPSKFNPGPSYNQYSSTILLSDGSATGIFGVVSVPEPNSQSLLLLSGFFALVFNLWRHQHSTLSE